MHTHKTNVDISILSQTLMQVSLPINGYVYEEMETKFTPILEEEDRKKIEVNVFLSMIRYFEGNQKKIHTRALT